MLIAAVLGGLFVQLSLGVLDVVPRLRSDIRQIQKIDLTGSLARLAVLVGLRLHFPERRRRRAGRFGTLLLQYLMLRRYAGESSTCTRRKTPKTAKR